MFTFVDYLDGTSVTISIRHGVSSHKTFFYLMLFLTKMHIFLTRYRHIYFQHSAPAP